MVQKIKPDDSQTESQPDTGARKWGTKIRARKWGSWWPYLNVYSKSSILPSGGRVFESTMLIIVDEKRIPNTPIRINICFDSYFSSALSEMDIKEDFWKIS